VQQEVVLAMLAKEPSHGYQLRGRLQLAFGPLGDAMNAGQIYVTLARLEKAGLVACERAAGLADRPDRKMYALVVAIVLVVLAAINAIFITVAEILHSELA
jgi:DNA-binding PadR family transcriptional regulator